MFNIYTKKIYSLHFLSGLKNTAVNEFKIYGGASCLYISEEDKKLYDNVSRFDCPDRNENKLNVASIKPIALLVPMSSIISNVASIRGVPFYKAFSDIAIFEVEPIDKLIQKLNEESEHDKEEVNLDLACISESIIRNEGALYIIASYGRKKNLMHNKDSNPINVKLNLLLENNVYIDECPPSIPLSACESIMIIESEQTATEGDGGAAVMRKQRNLPVLIGILSFRQHIGRAYTKFMFATRISEFHDFFCYYIGICIYEEFIDNQYWKHPDDVIIITDKAENDIYGMYHKSNGDMLSLSIHFIYVIAIF
uniref:Peptidase S1 domain-containing protein n=1 Tax=Wuchereria bancrofti TaxID=6293 RepID=A0A1I8EY26_WUCBA